MNVSLSRFLVLLSLLLVWCGALNGQAFRRDYNPPGSYSLDLVETSDGGFLLVGGISTDSSLFLQRTDAGGNVLWTAHQQLNGARAIAACAAANGGFAVLCENYSAGGDQRNLLLRIDSVGVSLWQSVLDNPSLPNGFRDLVATGDGGFALVGDGRRFVPVAETFIRLLRLDATGQPLWSREIGAVTASKELAVGLLEMPNGDLVVAGERRGAAPVVDESDFFLARTDAQGNLLWEQDYPKPGYQMALDFKADASGNLILLGESKKQNPAKAAVLKTAGNGMEIWFSQFLTLFDLAGDSDLRRISCFVADNAGNLYLPFSTFDSVNGLENLSLLKLSAAGDSVWMHESNLTDVPQEGLYTSDDRLAFTGSTSLTPGYGNAMLMKSDWNESFNSFFSSLSGSIYWDKNLNCTFDTLEPAPPNFILKAEDSFGEIFYKNVLSGGYYTINLPPGNYSLTALPFPGTETLWMPCDTPAVSIGTVGLAIQAPPLGIQSTADCPVLSVELSATPLRRCTTATYIVNYCNSGTQTASDAFVRLTPDPLVSYVSSTIPLAGQSGDSLYFDLGDLAPGDCASFKVKVLVDCAAENGQTLCAEAHIFPDSSCLPPSPLWDGSHVEVSAQCNGDAAFVISNTGTGDMGGPVEYVIIEDQIMYMNGTVQLAAGADTTITIANPTEPSYYIHASQRPGHPGQDYPAAVVDMCNGLPGPSLALLLALNNANPFVDIHCAPVVSSFDPNDKRGFPEGWRAEHFIEAGQDIDYTVRFQNTGADTAFLVVIRDQLPTQLDPATVRPGPSSHPYQFKLRDAGMLEFRFANILLPDSTTNEAGSHGFVNFKVAQRPGLPLGTRIENSAAIYFDFNEPIITNTWFHTIGRPLLSFVPDRPAPGGLELRIFPNPAFSFAEIQLVGAGSSGPYRFSLFDAAGRPLRASLFFENKFRFERGILPPGLYFFRVESAAGKTAGGQLILR